MHLNNQKKTKITDQELSDIIEKHSDKLYSIVYRMIDNHDDIMDILQETFYKTYKSIDNFHGNSSLFTYMVSIAINETRQYIRKKKKALFADINIDDEVLLSSRYPSIEENIIKRNNAEKLNNAIKKLPEKYREIIILKDIEGMKIKEIAEILNITIQTVKTRTHRGRLFLRELMENNIERM